MNRIFFFFLFIAMFFIKKSISLQATRPILYRSLSLLKKELSGSPYDHLDLSSFSLPENRYFAQETIGTVTVINTQRKFKVNLKEMFLDVGIIMKILGLQEFDVKLSFITDRNMFGLNSQYQGKEKSTDVLSFPKNDIKQPEILKHPSANLGNIYISPEYVNEVMKEDKEYFEKMNGQIEDSNDAGVSKALSTTFCLEDRYSMLIIHSILHLIGHDHETEDEWKLMTKREEEVLNQFKEIKSKIKK